MENSEDPDKMASIWTYTVGFLRRYIWLNMTKVNGRKVAILFGKMSLVKFLENSNFKNLCLQL